MIKRLSIGLTLALVVQLMGCSWQEHFTIGNLTDESIFVSYKTRALQEDKSFGIFTPRPRFYKVYKRGGINWDQQIHITDMDSTEHGVSVALPGNTVMIFGTLNNDNYESTEQYFINGRDFNLEFIEIEVDLNVNHIAVDTFDDHFTKKNGYIRYDVL